MKKMYSLMIIILSACLIFSQVGYAQNISSKTKIIVNGKIIETDKNIQVVNECVYVPVNDILKSLGYIIEYDASFKLVRAKKDENTIVIQTNDKSAKVNGKMVQMGEKPLLVKGSIFVPLDFIKESTGADISWNADTFTVDIFKKNDPVSTPARDIFEDQKVADRISADVNKTSAELMKLRTQEGSWQNVILNLVSEQKNIDKSMVAKFKSYFGSSEDTIIKMKYKLGNWVDVFGYLIVGKEKQDDSVFESKMKTKASNFVGFNDKEYVAKKVKEAIEEGVTGRISNIIEPLCGTYVSVSENVHYRWLDALKKVNNKIDFLDGAKYIGMPENVIKDLKDTGYFDYEIYIKARDTWVKGGSYTDKTTGVTTNIIEHRGKIIYINDVTATDPVDYMVKRELKIPDAMVDKCKQIGISDIVSIAKLNIWGITNDDDIKEFKNLTENYSITMDELNKIRMDYISWQQVAVFLFTRSK